MGLDIFFSEDIRNALLAANEASAATAAIVAQTGSDLSTLRAYREGYKAALATVALAFGLAPQTITLQPRAELERRSEMNTPNLEPELLELFRRLNPREQACLVLAMKSIICQNSNKTLTSLKCDSNTDVLQSEEGAEE